MTIKECIDNVDNIKPNEYSVEDKVQWLSFIDLIIVNDVLKTHEGYDGRYDDFTGYSADKLSEPLIVPSPYDRLYTAYLKMKIDGENGETARYNNSASLFNSYMMEYRKFYNKTHMPINPTNKERKRPPFKASVGLSEEEYENIKRDLFYMLSEHFATFTSQDKLYGIVTSYVNNNIQMLKDVYEDDVRLADESAKAAATSETKAAQSEANVDQMAKEVRSNTQIAQEFAGEFEKAVEEIIRRVILETNKISTVTLLANQWVGESSPYSQIVTIEGVTPKSQVDLTPSVEQLSIFYLKDLTFVTENDNGVVTVYAIGQKPQSDYTIQVTITETEGVITSG